MIVVLLIIIVCVLLFGAEKTKENIKVLLLSFLVLGLIAMLLQSCGAL